ncbi:Hypothetical predicted protein [Mytilus galloprovincialis]|uniref:G-protein coupled receptors family 1 profile domain-containing protein n=1 Tax=Mytilus galloprovincialis TaxID=29158 RepID=A0A8B6DWP8_MYTGA|nr:Hypothetical predicted protein [Mytilus galloprovincialis]
MALKLTIIFMIIFIVKGFSGAENQTCSDREDMNLTCTDFPTELSTDGAGNRDVCEITNLNEVVAPSAQADIYPLNTGSSSYFVRFDDSSMFSISLIKNCSRLRTEIMNILVFHLSGYKLSDDENSMTGLSIQTILKYIDNNICLKMHDKCREDTYYVSEEFIQGEHISTLMMTLAAGITVVNVFVISIFLKNENRSATTILLSCLAVSDTLTALLRSLPNFIVYQLFYDYIGFIRHTPRLYLIGYSFSILFNLAIEMSNGFHLLSVFITTLLCMQKAVALLFPFWSSSHLDKASLKGFWFVLILTLLLYLPISYFQIYTFNDVNGSCCKDQKKLIDIFDFYRYFYLTSNIITLFALSVVLACSVYITCKLTCIRKNLPWTDNFAIRRRNIKSAITVMLISVIFIFSESMYILSIILYVQWDSDSGEALSELYFNVRQYSDISLLIGFSLNFVVYLVMSEQLRKRISIGARGILERITCC